MSFCFVLLCFFQWWQSNWYKLDPCSQNQSAGHGLPLRFTGIWYGSVDGGVGVPSKGWYAESYHRNLHCPVFTLCVCSLSTRELGSFQILLYLTETAWEPIFVSCTEIKSGASLPRPSVPIDFSVFHCSAIFGGSEVGWIKIEAIWKKTAAR